MSNLVKPVKKIRVQKEIQQFTCLAHLQDESSDARNLVLKTWLGQSPEHPSLVNLNQIKALEKIDHDHLPKITLHQSKKSVGFTRPYYPLAQPLSAFLQLTADNLNSSTVEQLLTTLVTQLLPTLAYLTEQGITHGNINPEHILITKGKVYLIGFGFSCLRNQEDHCLNYPSPHCYASFLPDYSDLYGVGLSLIAFITQRDDLTELIDPKTHRVKFQNHIKIPGLSREFITWLKKLTHPRPAKRFPDATTALEQFRQIKTLRLPNPHQQRWLFLSKPLLAVSFGVAVVFGSLHHDQLWLSHHAHRTWGAEVDTLNQALGDYLNQQDQELEEINAHIEAQLEAAFQEKEAQLAQDIANLNEAEKTRIENLDQNLVSSLENLESQRENDLSNWQSHSSVWSDIQDKEQRLSFLSREDIVHELVIEEVNRRIGPPAPCGAIPEAICRPLLNAKRRKLEGDTQLRVAITQEVEAQRSQLRTDIQNLEAKLPGEKPKVQAKINQNIDQAIATQKAQTQQQKANTEAEYQAKREQAIAQIETEKAEQKAELEAELAGEKQAINQKKAQKITEISAQRPQLSAVVAETHEEFATPAKVSKWIGVLMGATVGVAVGAGSFILIVRWQRGKLSKYLAIAGISMMLVTAGVTVLVDVSFSEVVVIGVGVPALLVGTSTGLGLSFASLMVNQLSAEYRLMREYEVESSNLALPAFRLSRTCGDKPELFKKAS